MWLTELTAPQRGGEKEEVKSKCTVWEVKEKRARKRGRKCKGGGSRKTKWWKNRTIMSPPLVQGRPYQLENNCWVEEERGELAHMIDLSLIKILIACVQIPWVWYVHLAHVYRMCVCKYVHVNICLCVCMFICLVNVSGYDEHFKGVTDLFATHGCYGCVSWNFETIMLQVFFLFSVRLNSIYNYLRC